MGEEGKQQGLIFQSTPKDQNPIALIQSKFKHVQTGFKSWLSKQSLPVEAAVVTAVGCAQGGFMGAIMSTLTRDMSTNMPLPPQNNLDPKAMLTFHQAQALSGGPLIQARNFAVMTGVNAGISAVLKRLKGKEDVQSSMIAAFGSGAMFSLVSGVAGPNQIQNMVSSGLFFALAQGGVYKLGEKLSKAPSEDPSYLKTNSMLMNLGLQNYEKNFKRGQLNDQTLPLLTDRWQNQIWCWLEVRNQVVKQTAAKLCRRTAFAVVMKCWLFILHNIYLLVSSALRDARIPPGPRLVILDHCKRG